ncbi:hypothetical protein C8R47DRAFT_1164089 [Mycena vitilis]|nr:hypothetical protein C8R47DRAFT_1164089 [Mycena vitilis]
MVAPGGPAMDDDKGEHVERAKKQKKGKPSASLIAITAVAPKQPTKKAVRNGNTKWTLKDLPVGTAERFTNEVAPLAKELTGEFDPWEGPSVKQVQHTVNRVFGLDDDGKPVHKVIKDDAWIGLVNYRLNDWRAGFPTQAGKGLASLFDPANQQDDDDDYDDAEDTTPASGDAAGVHEHDDDDPMTAVTQPVAKRRNFKTPEGIAEYVEEMLTPHAESGTMPFHWQHWGNGVVKQGFLQEDLILYTFATHLAMLETIPSSYTRSTAPPIGALLLATQAVQRALGFWRTGVYNNPTPTPRTKYFSFDVWGDYTKPTGDKKSPHKLVRRATRFVGRLQQKWDAKRWAAFTAEATQWMEVPSRRRAGTSSRSASEAGDESILSDDDVVVIDSD